MILNQQNNAVGHAQNLGPHDNLIDTGYMGDCVCVIVMYNRNAAGTYANARGYHCGGGIDNVNYASLFNGVPNNAATSHIIIVSGPGNFTFYAQNHIRTHIRNGANAAGLFAVRVSIYHCRAKAIIDRRGWVQ